ncbi:MAG: SH3 domain-containing protein [Betaproteobacteria bacterium]
MTRKRMTTWMLGLALLAPVAAFAQPDQTAYTNRGVNMRAGPNQEFPLVKWLGAGLPVYVNGCVEGYTWCDVNAGNDRGWVSADYLSYSYQNQPVTIVSGGPVLGFPLVSFSIGPYWDTYYHGRSWYGNRNYWYGRPTNWWYRQGPQRYYAQPVVRPWPGYHQNWNNNNNHNRPSNWNNNNNNNRPPNWNNNNNNNRPPNWNNNNNNNDNNRPAANRPDRPQPSAPPRQQRVEKPATGEMNRSSSSQRTYTQQ